MNEKLLCKRTSSMSKNAVNALNVNSIDYRMHEETDDYRSGTYSPNAEARILKLSIVPNIPLSTIDIYPLIHRSSRIYILLKGVEYVLLDCSRSLLPQHNTYGSIIEYEQ